MNNLLLVLRELAWPAIISAGSAGLAVLVALSSPEKGTLVLALGLASVSSALLALRS
jgi:hypothetical protein